MPAQIVVTADTLLADKGLRGGINIMLGLECVGFFAAGQPVVVHAVALPPEQIKRLQTKWAEVLFHDHAVKRGVFCLSHRLLL
ncbi:hypothetical protein CO192_16210 [Halopseudomonas pelagia]|uniref:Uncharacterized protein n=1 Tax=Halopseudomonas pelagia TaxID=553151 RepID=A0AA91Z563_9GAMM|nr:hypothetical protein CO192_16210 [Halopseudomonas pelagia]